MIEMDDRRHMHPRASSASDREVMAASQMLPPGLPSTSEDLHAWSIYRQNLNSDFTDSALGSSEKSPMPYGNFHLRETTMQSIINNPKYGPKSELGTNMYTYLKFGLPRVMAPNRSENPNSSGYDSTDDDLGRRELRGGGTSRSRLRAARSEDILDGRDRTGGGRRRGNNRAGAGDTTSQWSQRENRRGSRLKSSMSEANLLNYDSGGGGGLRRGYRSNGHLNTFVNRGLVDELEQDYDDDVNDEEDEDEMERRRSNHRGGGGRMSKAQSQLSVVSRHSRATHLVDGGVSYRHEAPMLNDKYFPRDYLASGHQNGFHAPPTDHDGFKYPHLQLRNVCFSTKSGDRILDAITMEARGGELMAVMCTKQAEGTALCDILSNSYNSWQSNLHGDIFLNGVSVNPARLQDRVAYVRQNNSFCPDMSVRQTMLFHSFLREPGTHARARDAKGRINALIEDLGLSQVKHTRVKDLTFSERQRLNVACHLLLDTDIVVLDQPTRGMDIFDTFFLVEYLRQWSARGRIVFMTLHPPTYEILTMISKVMLISTGRVMYYGKRREMLPYFAFIEYPCPAYKNPSDYYLDLVTLDDLSNEAMLESSQRIDQLGNAFKRRAEPLSDPGPPGILPPKVKRANIIVQVFGIMIRAFVYMYPFNVINWFKMVLLSGAMSISLGAVFLGIRWRYWDSNWPSDPIFEQDNINDRLGFHHVFMSVGIWPMIMALITDEWRNKRPVTRDVEDRLYSKAAYIFTKSVYSIPTCGGVFLAYTVPGYILAGIHYNEVVARDFDVFYLYLGYMIFFLFTLRITSLSFTYLFNSRHLAAAVTGILLLPLSMVSGYIIHHKHLSIWTSWLTYLSPHYWMSHPIAQGEFNPVSTFRCTGNPVVTENLIIKQVACGLPSGEEVIKYFGYGDKFVSTTTDGEADDDTVGRHAPILITAAFFVVFQLLAFIFFLGRRQTTKRSRARKTKIM